MSPIQHQAIMVCIVCALAVLLTAGITITLLKRGKPATEQPASSTVELTPTEDISAHYQIDTGSSALLAETDDAGEEYLNETLFVGDSNTVRLYNNGLISLQQFCAKEGIGTQAALNDGIVTFKNDDTHYTIAQAVAMMKPRRVVITLGTNDTGMSVDDFISNYTVLVQAIQASYPYTDIIVNTVPPIPVDHSTYPNMDQTKIDDFNMALLSMCEQLGVKFLNSAETLKDSTGYGNADYYTSGDIHLKTGGLKAVLSYLRTHAYQTEDRRPDTSGIPTRTIEYSSNPSSNVATPVPTPESTAESVLYEASYQVEKSGGGTLSCGSDTGKTSLSYSITDASQSLSVTAVPAEGYVFVKWSDGETSKTRTDTDFKQNINVTAVFASASVNISYTSSFFGSSYVFKASLKGNYLSKDNIRWFANGAEVTEAAGMDTVEVSASLLHENSYKIYAVVSYNGSSVTSNVINLTLSGVSSSSSSSSSSSTSSSTSSSSESTSSSASTAPAPSSTSSSSSSAESTTETPDANGTASSTASSHSSSSSSSNSKPASSSSTAGESTSTASSGSSSHSEASSASSSSSHSTSTEAASSTTQSASSSSEGKTAAQLAEELTASRETD